MGVQLCICVLHLLPCVQWVWPMIYRNLRPMVVTSSHPGLQLLSQTFRGPTESSILCSSYMGPSWNFCTEYEFNGCLAIIFWGSSHFDNHWCHTPTVIAILTLRVCFMAFTSIPCNRSDPNAILAYKYR